MYNSLSIFHILAKAVGSDEYPKSNPNATKVASSGKKSTTLNSKIAFSLLTYSPNPYTNHAFGFVLCKSSIAFTTVFSKYGLFLNVVKFLVQSTICLIQWYGDMVGLYDSMIGPVVRIISWK